ncbi:MAG: metal-dependent transcriptional regulator [Marinilabilia sp.]
MSVSTENFIKNIYLLEQEGKHPVTSSLLARHLKISPAAVSDMAGRLGRQGLILHTPYQPFSLTEKGHKMALSVIRKHRLWELFLYKVLGMDLLSVHEEAEKLEHNTSEGLVERMFHYLGAPEYDPHGDPIPGLEGSIPSEKGVFPLNQFKAGEKGVIKKLRYRDNETKEMYTRYGIKQEQELVVRKVYAFDQSLEIESEGSSNFVISPELASCIFCWKK